MKRKAVGAILAQSVQAAVSLVLQILVARLLGIDDYGRFAILYGVVVLASAVVTGLVGDSLVVLDRADPRVRGGLQGVLIWVTASLAVIAGVVTAVTGFLDPGAAVVFAIALAMFVVEEVLRRLLMAHYAFVLVVGIDLVGFAVAGLVLLICALTVGLSLAIFFGAIASGQFAAIGVGSLLVPREDRMLVTLRAADYRAVWTYGTWRGLQQTLRPAMLTAVRLVVLAAAGVASVGMFEATRTYTSPLLLVVGGLSSFLFVRFAQRVKAGESGTRREADRVVVLLIGATVVMSAIALSLSPWIGPLAFGIDLDPIAVAAWLAYGLSVAMVTPYGALSAVTGRQIPVFLIRLCDTLLSLILVLVLVLANLPTAFVPFALAVASVLGGLALRWLASLPPSPRPAPDDRFDG